MASEQNVTSFSSLQADTDLVKSKILVLGSAPGILSLKKQQYYANPRNAFWWIMAEIFQFQHALAYNERVANLTQLGIVVWDVLASCERLGSLDSAINKGSEIANDVEGLLKLKPTIKVIACNGQKAYQLLKKHQSLVFDLECDILSLPSTSPAYAAMSKEKKLEKWKELKQYLH